jgi:hypothetical protein
MHVQRAVSNFAILVVGSLTSLVAFLSTRLNEVVFYVLAAACFVMLVVMVSTAKKRLGRRFPALLGKSIVPRWNIAISGARQASRAAIHREKNKPQFDVQRSTLLPAQPRRTRAA